MDDSAVRELIGRAEALLGDLDALTDQAARSVALEAVAALVGVYGEGLARMLTHIAELGAGAGADAVATACAGDELVSHLLLVHGLHPDDVGTRVRRAVESVRPALRAHGGDVDLLAVESGVVRLRLRGRCDGCASSAATLTATVEQAIRAAAPEIDQIKAEGIPGGPEGIPGDVPEGIPGDVPEGIPEPGRPGAGSAPAFIPLATVVGTGRTAGRTAGRATGQAIGRAR